MRAPFGKHAGAREVPHGTSGTEQRRSLHHAQAPAVFDHSRALPQGDGGTEPALAGGEEGGERDLIVLDASDVFDDAFAVRRPRIDAEGEVSPECGHLCPLLPHSSSTSRFTAVLSTAAQDDR